MAVATAITGIIAIFLNLYTIAYLKMGFMGWFWSTALSSGVMFLFFAYPVFFQYKLFPLMAFRKKFLIGQLKVSLPTIPHNYSSYLLNSSDRVVMDRLHLKLPAIGIYNMAYIFGNYFEFVATAVGMAISPHFTSLISKRNHKSEDDLFFISWWLQIGFILAGFILALWSKELMDLLISNKELKIGYPIAIIIIMSYVHRPYYWATVNRLQYYEKTAQLWKISFVAGILNLVLNFIFLPIYGVQAAAITTFVAMLYMGFSGFFLKSFKELDVMPYHPILMMACIVVLTILVYLIRDIAPLIKMVLSIILGGLFLFYSISKRKVFKAIEV